MSSISITTTMLCYIQNSKSSHIILFRGFISFIRSELRMHVNVFGSVDKQWSSHVTTECWLEWSPTYITSVIFIDTVVSFVYVHSTTSFSIAAESWRHEFIFCLAVCDNREEYSRMLSILDLVHDGLPTPVFLVLKSKHFRDFGKGGDNFFHYFSLSAIPKSE